MCYHISQTKIARQIERQYDVSLHDEKLREFFDRPTFHLNGFSHPKMLIIPQEETSKLTAAHWGIAPSKTQAHKLAEYYKQSIRFGGGLNAQSEKLFDHFIYKYSALSRRCLIPVTGFFEPHEHKKKKYPYYIHRANNESFTLAGIYTILDQVITFSVLTKDASPLFASIHNMRKRQPVILTKEFEQEWLNDSLTEIQVKELITPTYPENDLEVYTVSKDLFNPRIDSDMPTILDKVTYLELAG